MIPLRLRVLCPLAREPGRGHPSRRAGRGRTTSRVRAEFPALVHDLSELSGSFDTDNLSRTSASSRTSSRRWMRRACASGLRRRRRPELLLYRRYLTVRGADCGCPARQPPAAPAVQALFEASRTRIDTSASCCRACRVGNKEWRLAPLTGIIDYIDETPPTTLGERAEKDRRQNRRNGRSAFVGRFGDDRPFH